MLAIWLIIFSVTHNLYADTIPQTTDFQKSDNNIPPYHHVTLLYSATGTMQAEIAQKITKSFLKSHDNFITSEITTSDNNDDHGPEPELVIAIGLDSYEYANKIFRNAGKLLIASNPGDFRPVNETGTKEAVLYMSQPYCRKIQLIKLINPQWQSFSYLSSQNNTVDDGTIQKCADNFNIAAYKVTTTEEKQLTYYLKQALSQSDIILALPDKTIYNSKSVKNILLTSYRARKPIIAFSPNFVNAGALASIHSDAKQIAHSAGALAEKYFEQGRQFKKPVNYPQSFDISINRQVFRALDLPIPDITKLKQIIENTESASSGDGQ